MNRKRDSIKVLFYVALFSLVCLYLAAFPYVVVGKTLSFLDWESRDQILLPLGFSLLLFVIVRLVAKLFGEKTGLILVVAIVSLFIVKNGEVYYSYLLGNIKQQALIEEFKSNDLIRSNTSFFVSDRTQELNTLNRVYRFYEWTGLLRKTFGDQKRFAVNIERYQNKGYYEKYTYDSGYNIEGHNLNFPSHVINISFQNEDKKILRDIVWAYIFNKSDYLKLKHQLLKVKVTRVQ
ncbi:MAG: hypothetical protein Q9N62_02095 [Ghiorsea sp.]|nr:hypothetical protein [Ghiorsea sp.]